MTATKPGRAPPARVVRYPGASHGFVVIGRPSHRVDFNRRVIDWVETWTLGRGTQDAETTAKSS